MRRIDAMYVNGWRAALEEMRRPDWREVHDRTTRDIAAGRGHDLDIVARELGLEAWPRVSGRSADRRTARPRRQRSR